LSQTDPVVAVDGLHVEIPLASGVLHPVRDVSFSVERGETLCLVGESGCGKSLTALAVMGLLPGRARRSARRLEFDGQDLSRTRERHMADIRGNRLSMIFQEPMTSLNPAYTIGNQLMETLLRHRRVSHAEARERTVYLLEKVGITAAGSRLGQYPHQLSGGLRQRVMIAMALMCGPALIIADEPTTALDVTIQAQILALLNRLQQERGLAVLLITHDMGVVAQTADRVAVMYAGQIVEQATTVDLFAEPRHPYTHGLLASIPRPGVARLTPIPGQLPPLTALPAGCTFADRCAWAHEACRVAPPPVHGDAGHWQRCVLEGTALPQTSAR
jgi:peptide/nickel transport system ATP-binding protein